MGQLDYVNIGDFLARSTHADQNLFLSYFNARGNKRKQAQLFCPGGRKRALMSNRGRKEVWKKGWVYEISAPQRVLRSSKI